MPEYGYRLVRQGDDFQFGIGAFGDSSLMYDRMDVTTYEGGFAIAFADEGIDASVLVERYDNNGGLVGDRIAAGQSDWAVSLTSSSDGTLHLHTQASSTNRITEIGLSNLPTAFDLQSGVGNEAQIIDTGSGIFVVWSAYSDAGHTYPYRDIFGQFSAMTGHLPVIRSPFPAVINSKKMIRVFT